MYKHPERSKTAAVNRYLNGDTISKISQDFGISRTTVYSWIKDYNATFNKGKAPNFRYLHDLQQKCERQRIIIEILHRSPVASSEPLSKRYEVIKALSSEYNVNVLCEALNVAKCSYYNHILRNKNGATIATKRQSEMAPIIEQIFHENNEIFGSSKIYAILKDRGYAISESTVAKIMHNNGLFSIRTCAKTLYKQQLERKNNILQQQFSVSRPDEVWVSDVMYVSVFNRLYYKTSF
ncbi:MAG: helix-turn-helix domain-containing protein [Clostridia bacterium]|nr:helix-turn-helix domain-containing protein [Clostridia bacterium]